MSTPYVLPAGLVAAPLGIAWNQIPDIESTPQERFAEQLNISWRATHMVDSWCNQVLRSSLVTEEILGPDYYLSNPGNTGLNPARWHLQRWPITSVVGGQWTSARAFPPQWTALDSTNFLIDYFVSGDNTPSLASAAGAGPSAILIKPGIISFAFGRRGIRLNVNYMNGWPHAGIVQAATAGDVTLHVDDVSGFANSKAFIFDGDLTEQVHVDTAVATAPFMLSLGGGSLVIPVNTGPGTLTLTAPLQYTHNRMIQGQPTIISNLPESVLWATMLMASAVVFTRGATATTIQAMPGSSVNTGNATAMALMKQAQELLQPYRRVL